MKRMGLKRPYVVAIKGKGLFAFKTKGRAGFH